jgi:sulfur carrier protein ThiS
MKITVELRGYLDQYAPSENPTFPYEIPDGATVRDVLARLQIPDDLASAAIVGGEASDTERALSEGDRLTVVPPLAGGSPKT